MRKLNTSISLILVGVIFGSIGGYFVMASQYSDFEDLSSDQMLELIISQRDIAIKKAIEGGRYKCCIRPACTMCFMKGNKWNNNKAGTCACDEFIARGEEPCPQCKNGLEGSTSCQGEKEGIEEAETCKIKLDF